MSSLLQIEAEHGVTVLTLNRPERRNALTIGMLEELCQALERTTNDHSIRAIILKGAGIDFSSGFDLAEGQDLDKSLLHGELLCKAQLLLAFAPQLTIAFAAGYALAGGGALIASCDYAICLEDSRFGYPVLRLGIVPTPGMPFLARELSDRDFRALVLGGETWTGKQAGAAGLVNSVVGSVDEGIAEAYRIAGQVLGTSPDAFAATKKYANDIMRAELRREMEDALKVYQELRRGPQAAEGMRAFAEKRNPDWKSASSPTQPPIANNDPQ